MVGGPPTGYHIHTRSYIQPTILSATTPAVQLMLVRLLFGLLTLTSMDDKRVGRIVGSLIPSSELNKIRLGNMPGNRRKRLRFGDSNSYSRLEQI